MTRRGNLASNAVVFVMCVCVCVDLLTLGRWRNGRRANSEKRQAKAENDFDVVCACVLFYFGRWRKEANRLGFIYWFGRLVWHL